MRILKRGGSEKVVDDPFWALHCMTAQGMRIGWPQARGNVGARVAKLPQSRGRRGAPSAWEFFPECAGAAVDDGAELLVEVLPIAEAEGRGDRLERQRGVVEEVAGFFDAFEQDEARDPNAVDGFKAPRQVVRTQSRFFSELRDTGRVAEALGNSLDHLLHGAPRACLRGRVRFVGAAEKRAEEPGQQALRRRRRFGLALRVEVRDQPHEAARIEGRSRRRPETFRAPVRSARGEEVHAPVVAGRLNEITRTPPRWRHRDVAGLQAEPLCAEAYFARVFVKVDRHGVVGERVTVPLRQYRKSSGSENMRDWICRLDHGFLPQMPELGQLSRSARAATIAIMNSNDLPDSDTIRAQFEQDGFFLARAVFTGEQLDALEADFDRIVAQLTASGEEVNARWDSPEMQRLGAAQSKVLHTNHVQCYSSRWLAALQGDRFLHCVKSILGPDVILHHTKLFQKPGGEGAPFPMHQDWSYFPTKKDSMMAGVIHVSDADDEMGCFRVYPGTHALGRLENTSGKHGSHARDYPLEDATVLEAKRGDALFFHYFLMHGSMPNRSPRARKTVLAQMHAGNDAVEEGNHHPNSRLALAGWNHRVSRKRAAAAS